MADYMKKLRKGASDALVPGEDFMAAATWTPPAYRQGSKSGELEARRRTTARIAANPDALASRVTLFRGFLGITNKRVLFFGISPTLGKPTLLKAEFTLDEVDRFEIDPNTYLGFEAGAAGGAYELVFADESSVGLRLVSNGNEQVIHSLAVQKPATQG